MRIPKLSELPGASRVSNAIRGIESRLVGAVEDIDWAAAAHSVDTAVDAARLRYKTSRQGIRPTVAVPYRGWYADGVVHLTARTMEKPLFGPEDAASGLTDIMRTNLRRFTVLSMPGVRVQASLGQASAEFTSDAQGYLHITLEVGPLAPGWHVLDIDPVDDSVPHVTGRVLVADPRSDIAVISDIDDTIMKTGLTQGWTSVGRTLFRDVAGRKTVPGMSTFYAGLARGDGTPRTVPFFYVSTGSWNIYDYLVAFMNLHHFPRGPLFLTDWGPTADRLMRDGREHKRASIRALVQGHPDHDFVLLGDVGQGDPETYELMAREFPGRVRAIFLVSVGSHLVERTAEVGERAAALREEGIEMYCVANAAEAVTVAWQLGLVDQETTAQVAAEFQVS
ncbi:MAG: phosphatase domain-containing protein [Candidatus Nanopelagicales bacterium]